MSDAITFSKCVPWPGGDVWVMGGQRDGVRYGSSVRFSLSQEAAERMMREDIEAQFRGEPPAHRWSNT